MGADSGKLASGKRQGGAAGVDDRAAAERSGGESMSGEGRGRADEEGKPAAGRCTCLLCETAHRARRRLGL